MSEPTYEELKARLSELEKQGARRTGSLEFRVSEKGGVSVYGRAADSPLPSITNSGPACSRPPKNFENFLKKTNPS